MYFKCWWMIVISSLANGYTNENCGTWSTITDIFSRCKHDEKTATYNCTDIVLKEIDSNGITRNDIKVLIFKRCCLHSIDETAFVTMKKVLQLDLSYNSLNYLHFALFNQMKLLSDLNLQFNEIKTLDYRLFNSTVNLKSLDLSHNKLKTLDYRLFGELKQLTYLDLEFNELCSFYDGRLFMSQIKLGILSLGNNLLTYIDVSVLSPLNSLAKFNLSGNPLVCLSHIEPTVVWCMKRKLETNASCAYPPEIKGKSWDFAEFQTNETVNSSVDCNKNISSELCSMQGSSRNLIRSLTISLVCVVVLFVTISLILFIYCWRNSRGCFSTAGKTTISYPEHLTPNQYHESVLEMRPNVTAPNQCSGSVLESGEYSTSNEYYESVLETGQNNVAPKQCFEPVLVPEQSNSVYALPNNLVPVYDYVDSSELQRKENNSKEFQDSGV